MKSKSVTVAVVALVAFVVASCSSSASKSTPLGTTVRTTPQATNAPATEATTTVAPTTPATVATTVPASTTTTLPPLKTDAALSADIATQSTANPGCDLLDGARCLLPYPNNFYTKADPASPTGVRVNFPATAMPKNTGGTPIDPAEWNRNDGFSPNSTILTFANGIDAAKSKLPSWTDLQASLAADASVVLIDTTTQRRVPLWAELDAKATTDQDRLLIIHPAIGLPEGHHFVVGLRKLVGADGTAIASSSVFRAYRDRIDTGTGTLESRRAAMEQTFAVLGAAGVERKDLYLAWDFSVASTANLTSRMLAIRDAALASPSPPDNGFTVTASKDHPDTDGLVAREVTGTFTVPNFLSAGGGPGSSFNYAAGDANADRLPVQNGTLQASFICSVPTSATAPGAPPAHISLYGHGLLGSNDEVEAGNVRRMGNEHNIVFCATKWLGLSDDDVAAAAAALGNVSLFPAVTDRLQQGVLDTIVLGKLMKTTLFTDKSFAGLATYDTAHLVYDGNSQGGIMGLMLAAVSPDIERAVLGVPGMNYSLLLPRSVDFTEYEAVMIPAYPSELDRTLIISLMQMLWDRGEGSGYAQHVTTNPLEGTSAKPVLLDVAYGDHQVSELAAMVEARTIGAKLHVPMEAAGRSQEVTPGWGIEPIPSYPFDGSAIVIWDSGADPIPLTDTPPGGAHDPHEDPRADVSVRAQKAAFLFDHQLIDVCNGEPCTAAKS